MDPIIELKKIRDKKQQELNGKNKELVKNERKHAAERLKSYENVRDELRALVTSVSDAVLGIRGGLNETELQAMVEDLKNSLN